MSDKLKFMNDDDDSPEISHKDTIVGQVSENKIENDTANREISFFERVYYFTIDNPVERIFNSEKSALAYLLKFIAALQIINSGLILVAFIANSIGFFKDYFFKLNLLKGLYTYTEFSALSLGSFVLNVMFFYSVTNLVEIFRVSKNLKDTNYELYLQYVKTSKILFGLVFVLLLVYPLTLNLPAYYINGIVSATEFNLLKDYFQLCSNVNIFSK